MKQNATIGVCSCSKVLKHTHKPPTNHIKLGTLTNGRKFDPGLGLISCPATKWSNFQQARATLRGDFAASDGVCRALKTESGPDSYSMAN